MDPRTQWLDDSLDVKPPKALLRQNTSQVTKRERRASSASLASSVESPPSLSVDTFVPSTSRSSAPEQCSICLGPAKCRHYGVAACSACKAFFRRTLLTSKDFSCENGGDCNFVQSLRCRACRFERCLAVGMNPFAVSSASDTLQLEERVLKLVRGRARKWLFDPGSLPDDAPTLGVPSKMHCDTLQFAMLLELKSNRLRDSEYNPTEVFHLGLGDLLGGTSLLGQAERFPELVVPPNIVIPVKMWLIIDMLVAVEATKAMPFWPLLDRTDRELLVRNTSLAAAVTTEVYYTLETFHADTLTCPDGTAPMKYFKEDTVGLETEVFCRTLEPMRRTPISKEEYALAKAIIICNDAIVGLSLRAKKLIGEQRKKFASALLFHEQSRLGSGRGAAKYAAILSVIEGMLYFTERQRQLHNLIRLHYESGSDWVPFPMLMGIRLYDDAIT